MPDHQATVNLDFFVRRCQAAIQSRLHDLHLALNAHETGVAASMGTQFKANSGITISVNAPDSSAGTQNAFQNALLGANRDFTRYCEELMAIQQITSEGLKTITAEMSKIPVDELISRMIDERAVAIGQDPKIKALDKIAQFLASTNPAFPIAKSHVQLRNCIEHHYGTPKTDISVIAYALAMNVPVGGVLQAGETLSVGFQKRIIKYPAKKRILFQYDDVKDIITTTEQVILRAVHEAMLAGGPTRPIQARLPRKTLSKT
jgi:hypothetical protein